jgi:hypothetical protein
MRTCTTGFVLATACALTSIALAAQPKPVPPLWTPGHREVEKIAMSLLDAPEIKAARAEVVQRYEQSHSGQIADGKARMQGAIDELVYGTLLATVANDPAHPQIVWCETLPFTVGKHHVPASRYAGDNPDRIYRNVVVDPAYHYELRGKRGAKPSIDFSFEALPGPANWGLPPLSVIQPKDIDIAANGSFVVTLDSTPANGRRNHLQLPPGTQGMLLRDTISNWNTEQPNELTIVGLDELDSPAPDRAAMVKNSAAQLKRAIDVSLEFYDGIWKRPVNGLNTYVREAGWGVVGLNPFSLKDDEALVVTIDLIGARYFGLQVDDLWLRSADYVEQSTSLSNVQAKPNADGTITYVISKADPGVYNWIDTGGLNDGFLVGRWEVLTQNASAEKAVREVRVVKFSGLPKVLPDAQRVSPAERQQMLAARKVSYQLRLTP